MISEGPSGGGEGPQELVEALVDIGILGGGALCQPRPHVGVKGLAQVGSGPPYTPTPAVDGATVAGCAQEVPQQG